MKKKVFISIITILISIPLFMDTPLAEGNNVHTWAYGTYSSDFNSAIDNAQVDGVLNIPFGSSTLPIPVVKTRSFQEINFQMTNYFDGYVSMYFNNMPSTNLCDLYVSNATIQSWNWQTGYLSLAINGVDNFTVTLVNRSTFTSWLTSEVGITWSGISLTAVNAPAYSLHNMDLKLADCNSNLQSILSSVDNLESYTDNIETLLTDIKNYVDILDTTNSTVSSINTSVNNAYNKLTSIDSRISTVNNTLTSILAAVDNLEVYTDNIETLLTDIRTYTAILNNLSTKMDTNNIRLNSIIDKLNSISTQINQIINIVDNGNLPDYSYTFYTMLKDNARYEIQHSETFGKFYYDTANNIGQFSTTNNFSCNSNSDYVYIFLSNNAPLTPSLYFESSYSDITWTITDTYTLRGYHVFILRVKNTKAANYRRYSIEWDKNMTIIPIYYGSYYSIPMIVQQMTLFNAGDAYTRKLDEVKEAIRSMAVNVTNMTVNTTGITYNVNSTEVTNSVTNYNTNIDTVYNIENNFTTNFDNYNQQYNPDFTDITNKLNVTSGFMNNILTDMYDLSIIKYPTIMILAGIVLIAMLGV